MFNHEPYSTSEKHKLKIYLRCLAQAVDPDDFVHGGMSKWMSLYEQMCNEIQM